MQIRSAGTGTRTRNELAITLAGLVLRGSSNINTKRYSALIHARFSLSSKWNAWIHTTQLHANDAHPRLAAITKSLWWTHSHELNTMDHEFVDWNLGSNSCDETMCYSLSNRFHLMNRRPRPNFSLLLGSSLLRKLWGESIRVGNVKRTRVTIWSDLKIEASN